MRAPSKTSRLLLLLLTAGCSADVAGLGEPPPATPLPTPTPPPTPPATPTPPPEPVPSALTVEFPAPVSLTEATAVTVRGRASNVKSVRIGGVVAETSDNFASWQLHVPLSPGENTLLVESEDLTGKIDARAAELAVRSEPLLFMTPEAIAVDAVARRAFVIDPRAGQLIAVDLETGLRTLISGEARGVGPMWSFLTQIAIDTANGRALVVDSPAPFRPRDGALGAIDLATGDRTIISDQTKGTGPAFSAAVGIAVDDANQRALVFAQTEQPSSPPFETWGLMAIDLVTGDRRIVSGPTTGSGRSLIGGRGMALDASRRRALVVVDSNGYTGLVAVDLDTGDRTSITDVATEFGVGHHPRGATFDAANHRLFTAAESGTNNEPQLVAIDADTGERTITPVRGPSSGYGAISWDEIAGRVLVAAVEPVTDSVRMGVLVSVDVAAGISTPISTITAGTGPSLNAPSDVVFDAAMGRVLVVDRLRGLIAVDLRTSARTIVDDLGVADGDDALRPARIALDDANRRALILGHKRRSDSAQLVSVDLIAGGRVAIEGEGIELTGANGIGLDAARNRALVTAFGPPGTVALAEVDLTTGARAALISTQAGQGPRLLFHGLAVDVVNTRALVIDYINRGLVAVDLLTGDRVTISEDPTGNGPTFGSALIVDAASERAFVLGNRLIAVSLETGERTVVSGPEPGPTFPTGVAWGSSPCCALIVDDGLDALVLVDVVTGERVIVSGHGLAD